jgi:integrase
MILGRGTGQTDEEIIADYLHCLEVVGHIRNPDRLADVQHVPALLRRRIGKPIKEWSDADLLAIYEGRAETAAARYSNFLAFLFLRGYRRADLELLMALPFHLHSQWRKAYAPYQHRLQQVIRELGYTSEKGHVCLMTYLITLLIISGKPLEEITRADYEAFRHQWDQWYQKKRKGKRHFPGYRLTRFERILVHWGVIPEIKPVYRDDERFAQLESQSIRQAITSYLQWAQVKYSPSTVKTHRASILNFFLWVHQSFPQADRLDAVSRTMALTYGNFLKELVAERGYGRHYYYDNYSNLHRFFDFVLEEHLETAPSTNPFSLRDLPKKPEMIPRYLSDQEIRPLLAYCEQGATLFERTLIITLLHTGIRIMEFIQLKASDIVQIAGVWKFPRVAQREACFNAVASNHAHCPRLICGQAVLSRLLSRTDGVNTTATEAD